MAALDAAGDARPRPVGGDHRCRTGTPPRRRRADRPDLRRGPPPAHRRPRDAARPRRRAGPRRRLVTMAPRSPTPRQDLPFGPLGSARPVIRDLKLHYYGLFVRLFFTHPSHTSALINYYK